MYIIRFERILKTRSRSSIRIPKKHFYRLEKHSKLPFSFPPPFQTIMDRSLGTLSRSWGAFQCTQVQPLPSPLRQLMLDECIPNCFRVGWGEGELQKNFEKDALCRGNRELTEKYEYCSTVPRTFVQDCSYFQMAAIKLPSQENCFLQMKWPFFNFIEWRTSYFLSSLLLEIRTLKPS